MSTPDRTADLQAVVAIARAMLEANPEDTELALNTFIDPDGSLWAEQDPRVLNLMRLHAASAALLTGLCRDIANSNPQLFADERAVLDHITARIRDEQWP